MTEQSFMDRVSQLAAKDPELAPYVEGVKPYMQMVAGSEEEVAKLMRRFGHLVLDAEKEVGL